MRSSEPIEKIAVIADPLSIGMISAVLTARLPGPNYLFDVYIKDEVNLPSEIFARPNIRHVHQLLQIPEQNLRQLAGGKIVMALPVKPQFNEPFMLPLGQYGQAQGGCEFHHYWHRAFEQGRVGDLEHYNFALRLDQVEQAVERSPIGCPKVDPGYKFDRKKYGQYLWQMARRTGRVKKRDENIQVLLAAEGRYFLRVDDDIDRNYDLILQVSNSGKKEPIGWHQNHISIDPDTDLPGLFLYQVQSALARLFELWPQKNDMGLAAREYNRRLRAELEHISDMTNLCGQRDVSSVEGRLKRKVDLFRAKGRIAFEDYDVFSGAEWMAAIRASGITALGYDRLADRISIGDIVQWLDTIDEAISRHTIKTVKGRF